jgi:hypothetical protein
LSSALGGLLRVVCVQLLGFADAAAAPADVVDVLLGDLNTYSDYEAPIDLATRAGWRDGAPFAHCHGLFQDAAGHLACGHLRVESCMLGAGVVLTGHAWRGAAFVAQPCGETNFVLLWQFDPQAGLALTHPIDAPRPVRDYLEVQGKYRHLSPEQVAEGYIDIAVGNMAEAIKRISVQRGHDVTRYTLSVFGGAGGQHACRVADALGMTRIFAHPLAGVLSAYGMGLADQTAMREEAVERPQEGGQCLAAAGRRGDQHVLAGGDDRPAALLHRRRRREVAGEPAPGRLAEGLHEAASLGKPCPGRHPDVEWDAVGCVHWIPACAGMTGTGELTIRGLRKLYG